MRHSFMNHNLLVLLIIRKIKNNNHIHIQALNNNNIDVNIFNLWMKEIGVNIWIWNKKSLLYKYYTEYMIKNRYIKYLVMINSATMRNIIYRNKNIEKHGDISTRRNKN